MNALSIITRRLQETIHEDLLKIKINNHEKIDIYWGTAPTGKPSIAYLIPLMKLADFINCGCNVKILIADLHALIDATELNRKIVGARIDYYKTLITGIMSALNVPVSSYQFIIGSDFQLTSNYQLDLLKLEKRISIHDAQRAGSEVVKQSKNPNVSSLVYPIMQVLDEKYCLPNGGCQFGGVDQRKIFMLSDQISPTPIIHLMNPMMTSLSGKSGNKMSSSDPNSKIDYLDTYESVYAKIKKVFFETKNVNTPLIDLVEMIVLPFITIYHQEIKFVFLGIVIENIQTLKDIILNKDFDPLELKTIIADAICKLLAIIRTNINENIIEIEKYAYPLTCS